MTQNGRLQREDGTELAFITLAGRGPTVVFLPGFASDMNGAKATALAAWCATNGQAMLRFDYAGHGASGGAFADGTIGTWTADALLAIDRLTTGKLILAGSSMGGWIALLAALARPGRIAGLVGIAAAPDFTERLMWDAMAQPERAALLADGHICIPSQYGPPTIVTRKLIEEGRSHLLLDAPIDIFCPVRLIHGQRDPDVPWETAQRTADRLTADDVEITYVKDGDHRLSRERDLILMVSIVAALVSQLGGEDRP